MKKKNLIYIITIIFILCCLVIINLYGCKLDYKNDLNNSFDFDKINEDFWKGEEVTANEWNMYFDKSNFENVTTNYQYIRNNYITTVESKLNLKSKTYEQKEIGNGKQICFFLYYMKNKLYYGLGQSNEDKEIVWNKKIANDKVFDESPIIEPQISFCGLEKHYSDFFFENGVYVADKVDRYENVKINFKNKKIFMLSYSDEFYDHVLVVFRDYGVTKITVPGELIDLPIYNTKKKK